MLTHVLTLVVALIAPAVQQSGSAAQAPADPSQMSLAERARAARQAAAEKSSRPDSPGPGGLLPLTPEQRGSVRNNIYVNDYLHFRIDLGQWHALSDDRIAMIEDAMRNSHKMNGMAYHVLWLGDNSGRTAILTIIGLPPGVQRDLDNWADITKGIALAELSSVQDLAKYKEPVLLGDAAHKFAAFRVAGNLRDIEIVQSQQLTICDGFLITLVVTGRSHDDVSDALRSFKVGLVWATPAVRSASQPPRD